MDVYSYEAINFAGETINGEMEAADKDAVVEHLHRLGYVPLAAEKKAQHKPAKLEWLKLPHERKLSTSDIAFLTQELAIMLRAGLPLERVLSVLSSLSDQPHISRFLNDLLARVRQGSSLADALEAQNVNLPSGYIGMVRAGEIGGAQVLEATFERMAEHLKRLQKVRESIFSALLYPAIVLGMAALSIMLILLFVLPQFEPLFQSSADLPFSTSLVLAASRGLKDYGLFLLIAAVVAAFVLHRLFQKEDVKIRRDEFLLRLPKFGPLIIKAETGKFSNTLGVLLTNGVPPVTALSIAAESFGNRTFSAAAERVVARVREGETFSTPMAAETVFPPLLLQMIRIGEETGHLDNMLLKTAEIYDRDVQRSIERLMTMLVPIATIMLGIVIAAIIASVLSAILSVNDMVN